MNKEKPKSFAILPAEIRYCEKLSAAEKILYAEISVMSSQKGYCYAGNKYFANLYHVTTHTIANWMKNLEENQFIKRELTRGEKKNFTQRVIYVTTPVKNISYPPGQNCHTPYDENFMQNNTRENNIKDNNTSIIKKEKAITDFDEIIKDFSSDNELQNTIRDYIKMRKTIKKPLTNKGLQLVLKKLSKLSEDTSEQISILEQSIENSWQGIFPLKEDTSYNSKPEKKTDNIFLQMLLEEEERKKHAI